MLNQLGSQPLKVVKIIQLRIVAVVDSQSVAPNFVEPAYAMG
jgi:hypothetical protein